MLNMEPCHYRKTERNKFIKSQGVSEGLFSGTGFRLNIRFKIGEYWGGLKDNICVVLFVSGGVEKQDPNAGSSQKIKV